MTPEEACTFPLDLESHYGYVYCITFPNGKKYVGQSTNPWKIRWRQHISSASGCIALKNALLKYATEVLSWELVCYATSGEELNSLESSYIASWNTLAPSGYNLKDGGEGHIYSVLSKKKMSLSNTLAHIRKETGELQNTPELLELAKERVMYKACKKHRDTGFNVISFITAQNENVCLTAAQYNSKLHSRATYDDPIKGAALRKRHHEIQKALRSRPILCVELNVVFSCVTDALEAHPEWNREKINSCCRGERRTHRDLHFRYADLSPEELLRIEQRWAAPINKVNRGSWPSKPVYCIETKKTYTSAGTAARELNIERTHIPDVCRGKRGSVSGYHFVYSNAPSQDSL